MTKAVFKIVHSYFLLRSLTPSIILFASFQKKQHKQMNETFQQPGRWHDVILTPTPRASSEPLTHFMFYTLKGLQPSAVYESIVQAKNRYGWNEVSFLIYICILSL